MSKFKCDYCGKTFKTNGYLIRHLRSYCLKNSDLKPKTKEELRKENKLSKEKRSEINRKNGYKGNIKLKELLKVPGYKKHFGERVSESILKSEKAIKARKENMTNLNKSKEQREKASKHLKNKWKEDGFNEKSHAWQIDKEKVRAVTEKSLIKARETSTFVSKSEKNIKNWLKDLGYKTKTNRFIIENTNRFYDIRIGNLLIEIDGPWHFEEFYSRFKNPNFDPSIDKLKNEYAVNNGFILLRVSNWGDRLEDQKNIVKAYIDNIDNLPPGIYYEGVKYEN